jgi:hypothetical protein
VVRLGNRIFARTTVRQRDGIEKPALKLRLLIYHKPGAALNPSLDVGNQEGQRFARGSLDFRMVWIISIRHVIGY